MVLPHGDSPHFRGSAAGNADVCSYCHIYCVEAATGSTIAKGELGGVALRTVTVARGTGNLLLSTCDRDGRNVRLIEMASFGTPLRIVRLDDIESHRLLSNVQMAADNESFVVASESVDEGPEKISIFKRADAAIDASSLKVDLNKLTSVTSRTLLKRKLDEFLRTTDAANGMQLSAQATLVVYFFVCVINISLCIYSRVLRNFALSFKT